MTTRKNLFCPNLSLPENKALVEKLGLAGFYREYVKNNFVIPQSLYEDIYDGVLSVEDMIYVNKDLFTGTQQEEVVDSILYQVQQYRQEGIESVREIKSNILSDFRETIEYFQQEYSAEESEAIVTSLNNVINNFDAFFEKVNKKLASQDITIDTNDTSDFNNEESSYDSAENLNQKLNYSDDSNFKQSSKDTASANLKIALSLIPKYVYENGEVVLDSEGNAETELSFIGSPTFESLDSIWNDMLYTLVDVPIGEKLDYLSRSTNPKHRMIYQHIIDNTDESIRNQFESVFSKQQAKFVTVNYSRPDKTNTKTIRVFDTNRLNADNLLIDSWYESFLGSSAVANINGNKAVNVERGKQLLEEYNNAVEATKTNLNQGLTQVKNVLGKIGIDISMKALKSEGIRSNGEFITPSDIINNKLKYVFNSLAGNTNVTSQVEDALELNNPYIDENSTLDLLAKLENKANPTTFEASFVSGDGKAKYSFVNNTYVSHKMRKLKTDPAYMQQLKGTAYASGSFYLNKLINDPSFRDVFELQYVDTLGNESVNQPNKTFSRMNTKEKELTKIGLFQNSGQGTTVKDSNIGQFIGLVPSDKSTTPVFKTLKVNVRVSNTTNVDGNYTFNNDTMEVMYDQFMSEYNRVKQTFKEIGNPDIRQIDQYHTGAQIGKRFVIFPFMNTLLIQNDQLLELDDIRLEEIVRPRLQKFLSDLTKDQIAYWKELGVFPNTDNYSNFFDKSYAKKNGISLSKEQTNEQLERFGNAFAATYAVNQFIFMMNQTQLISGDPALHGKSVLRDLDPDTGSAYNKTWINFYKRMAKDIAPGTDGNFGTNSNFNTIYLQDLKYASENLMNYMEKVSAEIGQNYAEINPADAQEYTTLDEHLDVMRAYGRLDQAGEEAAERLKQGGTDINDIKLILQPMKPVYVNSQIEGGINTMYYIKSSSFPLVPALTAGLEIDKLRVAMENNNIQRAAYESAVKLGLQGNISNISNDGGTVFNELNIDSSQIINLGREGFRLQQEMPYHGDHPHINEGSQGRKLILNNLDNTEVLNFNGNQYTGREMKEIFENLHIEKMDRSLNKLVTDLGFSNETGKLENISKIQEMLRDEAESRDYPVNDLYSIQLITENGQTRFKVPLSFTNNATRFESILNSVFTNRVIKSELPGFMGIQGASSGFSRIMSDADLAGSIIESGITWINPNDTKLNYIRENDNGEIESADILVPNYFRNEAGDQINLKDYIDAEGNLDTNRIPEELLTVIGLRIPTQGYNSMMKFRVKGFLPNLVGDLVIVPAEVTIQMGSDFDVDKLFIYRYNYNMGKDGNLSKVTTELPASASDINYASLSEQQIENLIIQTFEDRLSDKRLMDQILTPNGFGNLPAVANEVAKLTSGKQAIHTFSTRDQNSISDINVAGKTGTGIFSLFSTFNKAAQDADLKSAYTIKTKNSKGEVVELNSLSDVNNIEGNKRSDVIMYLQSAAVDNAKEQILGKLNINDYTMGVAGTLAMLGVSEDYIGYFLSQPSLREYSSRVSNANDIVSGTIDPTATTRIIGELIAERLKSTKDIPVETKIKIVNIPFGVEELRQNLINNNTDSLELTQFTPEELTAISQIEDLFQFSILSKFEILLELANNIQTLQSATNLDTKGLGATYGAIQAKNIQLERVLEGILAAEYPILNADRLFAGNTVQKANEVLIKANALLGQIYTYNSASYQKLINDILKDSSLSPTEANLKDIYANLKSFILTNPELLNLEEVNTVRDSLLYGKDNIAKRWLEYSQSTLGKRNPLTKRILPKLSKSNEDYNGLKAVNTPASNNSHDINTSIMYFYDMINSTDSVERQLAEDMVRYHVLTGANYGAQSIGKYITYDVLEKYDFSKKLRDIDDLLRNTELFDSFTRQYFQNNPFKASTFDVEQIGGKLAETIVVNINNNPLRNKNNEPVMYFAVYDANARTPVLYERSSVSPTHLEYTKIPVLGNKLIKKYNYLDNNVGAINTPTRESLPTGNVFIEALNEDMSTTESIQSRYGANNNVSEILSNIASKSDNTYFAGIANDLLNSNSLENVNVQYSTDRLANGWYNSDSNTVFINPDAIKSTGKDILSKFEEVFLHELLHAGTVGSINNYDNLSDDKKKLVKKIQRLFTEYVKTFEDQDGLLRFININNERLKGNKISEEEWNYLRTNKDTMYPLTNVKEFIAAGLTNPEFTDNLKSKNLWTRLLDFIADLLGVNTNDLQFLYNSTIELIDNNQSSSQVNEDLFTTANDEYNRQEFVRQRDEFLTNHRTFIGKRVTDNTLQKFIESAKKDKYNRLKISSWNGELRISRVDPIYEDITEGKAEKESPKDRAINSYIDRIKDSLKRFRNRKRQLGDDVDPVLDNKIAQLEARLKSLESERSISNFMNTAESKLNDISDNLNDYNDTDSINDALSYTSALKGINETIEFTEEFEDWNNRLDAISAKAVKLNKRILKKGADILSSNVNNNLGINYNVSTALNKGLTDVGSAESLFLDPTQSSSQDVQVIGYMVEKYQFEANQEHDEFNEEFIPLVEAYKSKYGNNYNQLLQLDKGKPTGFLLNKFSQDFYEKARGNFKFFNSNTNVEFSDEAKARYESDKKQAYENLSTNDYLAWENNNNPYEFIKTWKLGKNPTQGGAKRYVKITPKDNWIDSNYSKLKALPESDPARQLYDFIEPILRRNNKRYGQQSNYIPELQKSTSELLLDGKTKDAYNGLKEGLLDTFQNDLTVNQSDVDILTGEPRLHIPVQMFNNQLDVNNKSFDLPLITEKVKYQEISLKYKYQAEPVLNLYYAILKNSNQFLKYDEEGMPITIDKPATKLLEHSQFIIQNYLYNKNRTISKNEARMGKTTDKLISYARLVGMGWNPFSAIGNITQGLTSNFTYSAGSNYFNKKEYTQATGLMLHTLAGNTDVAKKISKMFLKFDTFVKTNELNFGKSKELATATQSKFKDLIEPYNMQQKGEYFIQGQTMVGILLNTKIDTPDGKISLFDGYDSNGKWMSKYGEDPMKDKQKLFKMTQKIRKAIIDVHGNYSRPLQAKKDFYWRAALMFRTWLPQAINVRFGAETTDVLLGTTTKGRYNTVLDGTFFKNSNGKLDLQATADNVKWLLGLSKNTSLSELDKSNMRKNLAELAMILAITLAVAGIKAGLDDLDDDEKLYTTYVLNTMSRTYGDLTFFMSPESFSTIIQDPIPLMRSIDNTLDILPAGWNFIIGEDEYKTGVRKGRSKLGKEITDLVPFITQVDKNWTYMNQVFD